MTICRKHGQGIVYSTTTCPACDEVEALNITVEDLKDRVEDLKELVKEFQYA